MILPTLLTLLPMLVIAAPAALPSDTFTISPSANSTLCMTYEPLSAYHGDSSGGTINLLTCFPPSSTYSPAQHWSIPPVGQTSGGAIRYGGPDGRMCLTVDDVPRDGAKLKLWWCLGLPEQKWVMRKDGMIQLEGYNACLDVRKESERVRLTKGPFGEREKELQVWNCMDGSEQQTFTVTAQ